MMDRLPSQRCCATLLTGRDLSEWVARRRRAGGAAAAGGPACGCVCIGRGGEGAALSKFRGEERASESQ